MIVDAHHHFWDPSRAAYPWLAAAEWAPVRRPFGPADLAPHLAACGVEGTVLVQTRSSLDETREFLRIAARTAFIAGVVGWVDLTNDRVGEALTALQEAEGGEKLVGIRHQVQDEEDPIWLLREEVQRGLAAVGAADLAYDLLVRARELPAACETVRRHPTMRFVLDHLAKPPIREGGSTVWESGMARLAKQGNVACKLSGLVTEADWGGWTLEEFRPYAARALAWFGPERILFGSDWPVCLVAAPYARVVETARHLIGQLPPTQQAAIFGENARRIYKLRSS